MSEADGVKQPRRDNALEHRPGAGGEAAASTFSNFDYIRLAAAVSVIFSHSFLIAYGNEFSEPLVRILGPKNIVGIYGVFVFFLMSGFLITRSAVRARSIFEYMWHRVVRICPAFIVCVLVCGALAGFRSALSMHDYWYRLIPLKYLLHALASPGGGGWSIPTVTLYAGGGWLAQGVNGSLWTIPHEIICYVIVGMLMAASAIRWPVAVFACAACVPLVVLGMPPVSKFLGQFLFVAPPFAVGSMIYLIWPRGKFPAWPVVPCLLIGIVAVVTGKVQGLFPFYAGYPLIWLATSRHLSLPSLKKMGDLSYGLYLYGWPSEQAARAWLGPGSHWWEVFIIGLTLATVCAFLSWRLIEKPALSLKGLVRGRPTPVSIYAPST